MRNIHDVVAVGLVLAVMGCGSAEEAALLQQAATAGSGALRPLHWSGVQSCKGKAGSDDVLSSDQTELDNYTATKTQVQLRGLRVGPSSEYSCGPLDVDGAVTRVSGGGRFFESPKHTACTSASGHALVVSQVEGYDLDQRMAGSIGQWDLSFDVRIDAEDAPADAGAAEHHLPLRADAAVTQQTQPRSPQELPPPGRPRLRLHEPNRAAAGMVICA
jgi:hypothetical protein